MTFPASFTTTTITEVSKYHNVYGILKNDNVLFNQPANLYAQSSISGGETLS